jgi:undecaprenyl-diphosphatase
VSPLYQFDLKWFRAINIGLHHPVLDVIFAFFSYLGLGGSLCLIALGMLVFKQTRHYTLPLLATQLLAFFTAQVPKRLLARDRPSILNFAHPQEAASAYSFPSGHTTSSFAFAFMIFFLTVKTKRAWAGYLCLFLAVLVGISRIYRGVHWPSDVIAGVFDGCATAAICYLILDSLGRLANLDTPETSLTGRETTEAQAPAEP